MNKFHNRENLDAQAEAEYQEFLSEENRGDKCERCDTEPPEHGHCPLCCGVVFSTRDEECALCLHYDECSGTGANDD